MNNLLLEINEIAKEGYDTAISNNESISKKYFYDILIKTEMVICGTNEIAENHTNITIEKEYDKLSPVAQEKVFIAAYCFSNYEHNLLYADLNQHESFIKAAKTLGVKEPTFRQTCDYFDANNNNHRKGYWQSPLPARLLAIKDKYDKKTKEEVINITKNILGLK